MKATSSMRMQELVKDSDSTGHGIYTYIQTRADFDKFFALCKEHHPTCYEFSNGARWTPSEANITKYQLGGCIAYISGISLVVGVSPTKNLTEFHGYCELADTKVQLLNLVKNFKE